MRLIYVTGTSILSFFSVLPPVLFLTVLMETVDHRHLIR